MTDKTRSLKFNQKRDVCVMVAEIDVADVKTAMNVNDTFEIAVLPENIVVDSADLYVVTANDAATSAAADLGFDGDNSLVAAADLKATGSNVSRTRTHKALKSTVTFKPTYTGAMTEGKVYAVIEYIELDKVTGNLTNYL